MKLKYQIKRLIVKLKLLRLYFVSNSFCDNPLYDRRTDDCPFTHRECERCKYYTKWLLTAANILPF